MNESEMGLINYRNVFALGLIQINYSLTCLRGNVIMANFRNVITLKTKNSHNRAYDGKV